MASNFGISELRSKFDRWRNTRKDDRETTELQGEAGALSVHVVDDPERAFTLSMMLESLVIPKLIADGGNPSGRLSSQGLAESEGTDRRRPIDTHDVIAFTQLTLNSEAATLLDFVDNCLATGNSIDAIYMELLAPSARRLGEFWEQDSKDFVDVTMALWRIQETMRELSLRVPASPREGHGQRSALFSTLPGEHHTFGTTMVGECFERSGWDTDVLVAPDGSELRQRVANNFYDLVGLTVSCDCPSDRLSSLVATIKSISKNTKTRVMLGGKHINEHPELIDQCNADGTATDAQSALSVADELVPLKTGVHATLI